MRTGFPCLRFCIAVACFASITSANELSLVVAGTTKLQLSPSLLGESSPASKPGTQMFCERVQIHGLSRFKDLRKFSHSLKVKVSRVNSSARAPNIEVCFHRNISLGLGMCPEGQWEKLIKGSWIRSMSPFDHKLLDVRIVGLSTEKLEVSIEEEFFLYRFLLLVFGIILMTLASYLSKALVFYYSSAMAVGIVLVILMVLFQGMKLLPTGRKNSLAIFLYSSIVGLGSFLLRYLPKVLQSILVEMGVSEDMYYPLVLFLLVFLFLVGAWLGFWAVRMIVLTEDGLVDMGVSQFVMWSIRIFSAAMILQSTVDPLLAAEALACGILVSSILRKVSRWRFKRHVYKKLHRTEKSSHRTSGIPESYPVRHSYDRYINNMQWPDNSEFTVSPSEPFNSPFRGSTCINPCQLSDADSYYSTFHDTPERRKFSKGEWEKFTKDSTKRALEGLVSSPDFSDWAVANAERITLTPKNTTSYQQRRWFNWTSS